MIIGAVRRWECGVFAPSTHESTSGRRQPDARLRRRVERAHVGGQRLRQCVLCRAIVLAHWCVHWACALGCVIRPSAAGSCLAGRAAGPLGCVRWLLRPALSHTTTRRTLRAARSHSRTPGLRATQALRVCSLCVHSQLSVRSGWWAGCKVRFAPQNQPRWFSPPQQWRCHSHCSTLSSRQTTHSCTLCHTLPTCAAGAVVVAPCVRARGGAESQGARRRPWKLVRWSCWCGRS